MAQFFVLSKQIFAPELLIPGEKPHGFVEINKNHTSARGLTSYKIFSRAHGIADLVDGSGGTITGDILEGDRNNSIHCDIDADYVDFDREPIAGHSTWAFLICLEMTVADLDTSRLIVGNYTSGSNSWGLYQGTDGGGEFLTFLSGSNGINVTIVDSDKGDWGLYEPVIALVTCDGSRVAAYSNAFGERHIHVDFTVSDPVLVDSNGFSMGRKWFSTAKEFNAYFAAGWSRYIPQDEAFEIIENPYLFLKPIGSQWYQFDVGGAPTTKPALLMSAGQIKQYTDESPNRPLCINADGSVEGYLVVAGKKPLVVDTGNMRVLGVGETLDR